MFTVTLYLAEVHGFSAETGGSGSLSCNEGDRINFPNVITNVGGGYIPGTSEFIRPVSGVYMFTAVVTSARDEYGRFEIILDGTKKATVWSDGRVNGYGQASNTVILECNAGNKVWVECAYSTSRVNDTPDHLYNIFSGMLVHATGSEEV